MHTFFTVVFVMVEVITGLLLVGIVLLQKSKDEGLGITFGSGMGETLFGSRTGNVLTKITIILAIVFLLDTVIIVRMTSHGGGSHSLAERLPERTAPVAPPPGAVAPATMPAEVPAEVPAAAPAVPPSAPQPAQPAEPAATPAPAPAAPAPAPAK